ncbi:hypothetical protein [Metabacillus sediminilitoris]|uniref:hypothetical protein n=1 Tax=Metabacillus sediminilitoris TaxID=2567941 RepID=UPI0012D78EAB|nr:hypothetical protein [Metabacillus sediminilitoris]QGQ48173.1 hypothetical protein GMB29_24675 [Metabacillus sediminilitoris]
MEFEHNEKIWDELHEISTGQVPNGFEKLEEMFENGLIDYADYEDAKKTLSNLFL